MPPPSNRIDRPPSAVLAFVVRHAGNRSAMARAERLSLNTIRRLIRENALEATADALAVASHRRGIRPHAPADDDEPSRILSTLTMHNMHDAADALGMSVATLYRRRQACGITREDVRELRQSSAPGGRPPAAP